jgi:hypothetical protein
MGSIANSITEMSGIRYIQLRNVSSVSSCVPSSCSNLGNSKKVINCTMCLSSPPWAKWHAANSWTHPIGSEVQVRDLAQSSVFHEYSWARRMSIRWERHGEMHDGRVGIRRRD